MANSTFGSLVNKQKFRHGEIHRKIVINSLHGSKMLGYIHLNIKLVPNRNDLVPNRDITP
jgi:hypothetical protein